MQKTHTTQIDTTQNYLHVSERHIDVFFCTQCCHEVLPLVIKLVVTGLSICHQVRRGLILETDAQSFLFLRRGKIQHILDHCCSSSINIHFVYVCVRC